jgi:hypothetical protein
MAHGVALAQRRCEREQGEAAASLLPERRDK